MKTPEPSSDLAAALAREEAAISHDPRTAATQLRALADRARSAKDVVIAARALRSAARALAYAGQYEESLGCARRAVEDAAATGLREECGRARLAAMHALVETGRLDEALAEGELARDGFAAIPAPSLVARAQINLGIVFNRQGRLDDALACFDSAIPALVAEPLIGAQLQNNRAETLLRLFRFADARTAFEHARDMNREAGAALTTAIAEGNLADLDARMGLWGQAILGFDRAIAALREVVSPGHELRLRAERAEASAAMGLVDSACTEFEALVAELDANSLRREAARARAALGRACALAGKSSQARTALLAAQAEFNALGDHLEASRVLLDRAEIHLATDPLQSTPLIHAALAGANMIGVDRARCELLLAEVACAARSPDEAIAHADLARAVAVGVPHVEAAADILAAKAMQSQDRFAEATRRSHAACVQLDRVRGALPARQFRLAFPDAARAHRAHLGLLLDDPRSDPFAVIAAIEAIEQQALLEDSLSVDLADPRSLTVDPLLAERARLAQELNALCSMVADTRGSDARQVPWRSRLAALEGSLDDVENRMERQRGSGYCDLRSIGADGVQSLAHTTAFIRFGEHDGEIFAVIAGPHGARTLRRLGVRADFERLSRAIHFQMREAIRSGNLRSASSSLRSLLARADDLLSSAWLDPRAGTRPLVIPTDSVAGIPFMALPSVAEIPGGLRLAPTVTIAARTFERQASAMSDVLAVAFDDGAIPGVTGEVESVARIWGSRASTLAGPDATTNLVRERAPRARILHFACHGWCATTSAQTSGLRLADRWLNRRELRSLRLDADIVVLSACETGPGATGGDSAGLASAFLAAGARAVLATMWTVRDDFCIQLMDNLHSRWKSGGRGGLGAGWGDAVASIRTTYPHPADWSSFVLYGEPDVL